MLQFGTGRFSRAFVDYFVDKANQARLFDGSVVCVQSTGSDRADLLNARKGRFNVWLRGIEDDETVDRIEEVASISRVLVANTDWDQVLECAHNPDLAVVTSIVSEVGFVLDTDDSRDSSPPDSFPAKLTLILYERAKAFDFSESAGLVMLPCENIEDSGNKLKAMVLEMASAWNLEPRFSEWIEGANQFCNTLVDRIVTGTPTESDQKLATSRLGYRDPMITVAEPYALWAVEAQPGLRDQLPFLKAHPGIIVDPDIAPYRERKLRLLNGGHTLTVPLGILLGNKTVLDNMEHPISGPFIEGLLREEIGPTLPVDPATVSPYIDEVLERWLNPFLNHKLVDIAWQSTSKMRFRVVPSILRYNQKYGMPPRLMAAGFAAYLALTQPQYGLVDENVELVRTLWKSGLDNDGQDYIGPVRSVCSSVHLWGADLASLAGWVHEVSTALAKIEGMDFQSIT